MKIVATDILDVTIKDFEFKVLKLESAIDFPQLNGVKEIWIFYDDFNELLSLEWQDTKNLIYIDIPDSYFALWVPAIWDLGKRKKIFFKGKVFTTLNILRKLNSIL